MKKNKRAFLIGGDNRVKKLLIFIMLVIMQITAFAIPANAKTTTSKVEKSYEIAVVFDNSGSMYTNQSWCRAKYAMEIFASMLNYDNGDKLRIYPMWEVTTDGSKPSSGGSYAAIEINNKKDIDKISNLFTVNPSDTPFAPVTEAQQYLKSSKATEKWIIVLTDGEFNQIERGKSVGTLSETDLRNRLIGVATDGIKVQYLGFEKAAVLKSEESKGFYAKKSDNKSLKDDLIAICNSIFQRSVLKSDRLSGTSLNLDLSMKNLIVFAQGKNAKITSLTDESGKEIAITLDSGQRKYSEIGANKYASAPIDDSLAGQVVTFDACPKGQYTLNYSGADAIQIFYEPDVDIKVTLTNNDGIDVDGSSGEIPAGEYTITSTIVDSSSGEDVTDHELMGNDVTLTTIIKNAESPDGAEYPNGSKVTFKPEAAMDIIVKGTYLKDYTITSENDPELAWLNGIKITDISEFSVNTDVLQPQSWYTTTDEENWEPIKVSLALNDQPLTPEQMANTDINIDFGKDLTYWYKAAPDESAYYIYIGHDESGTYDKPETGIYQAQVSVTYIDEYGTEKTDSDNALFEIQWYSIIWRWLLWIVILVVLLIIITIIRNHPTLPSAIYLNIPKNKTCKTVKKNGKNLSLSTNLFPGELRCEAKPYTPLKNKGKRSARFKVKNIKPLPTVQWYSIDGERFTKSTNGKYVNSEGKTIDSLKTMPIVGNDSEIKWKTNLGIRTGYVYINHKN